MKIFSWLAGLFRRKPAPVVPQVVVRLEPEVLRQLMAKLPMPVVTRDTTDIQSGYLLGLAHVERMLRDGFTIGS